MTTIDLTAFAFLRPWFQTLRQNGHRVTLATTVGKFREPLEKVTDEIIHLPMARSISPLADLRSLLALMALMRKMRPDVVHSHTSKAGLLCRLAARLAGVPLILHTIHELPQNAARRPLVKRVYRDLERLAARWAHHLITVSYTNEKQILAEKICPPAKLTTIREGLPLDEYVPARSPEDVRREWGIPEGALVIGTAARLEPAKGHRYLLDAFALLGRPDVYLVCMGAGHLEKELRERAAGKQVIFTGWMEDLVSGIHALDLFVLPSLYEGLGIVLLEAMALRKAVISSRVGGTQDVVVPGETGLFVPPRDPIGLARAIAQLLDNPVQRQQFGQAGRRRVEEEFRAERADAQMLELYLRLSSRPR